MKLLDQVQTIDKSAVAQDIAKSFIIGFSVAALPLILPLIDLASFGTSLQHFVAAAESPAWLYHFFDAAFTGALSASIGLRLKSAFDHFTLGFYGSDAPVKNPSSAPSPDPKNNP